MPLTSLDRWSQAGPAAPVRTGRGVIRVYLVDDHDLVRDALTDLLGDEPDIEVVGHCGSALEAVLGIPALRPDVVLLDVHLPDGSGIRVCEHMRSLDPAIKTLILTAEDGPDVAYAAMLAGASGCLLKQIRGLDLPTAIRAAAAGRRLLDPTSAAPSRAPAPAPTLPAIPG